MEEPKENFQQKIAHPITDNFLEEIDSAVMKKDDIFCEFEAFEIFNVDHLRKEQTD